MGAVPDLGNALPFEDTNLTSYWEPATTAIVTVYWVPELANVDVPNAGLMPVVTFALFTHNSLIVMAFVPVLLNVTIIFPLVASPTVNVRFVTCPCSVAMKLNVSAPIHAATAMLTATVTAMSMIEATTGLRAFLLLNIFIFFLSLLLELLSILVEATLLNLTTHYTRLPMCMTKIRKLQGRTASLVYSER